MNSIVELIKKGKVLNEFNMTNTTGQLINNVYNRNYLNSDEEVPIEVSKKAEWDVIEGNGITYLQKVFSFSMTKHLLYFINETINECKQYHHFPELIVTENFVDIRLYTKDINDVTDIDKKLSKKIVDIYQEIKVLYWGIMSIFMSEGLEEIINKEDLVESDIVDTDFLMFLKIKKMYFKIINLNFKKKEISLLLNDENIESFLNEFNSNNLIDIYIKRTLMFSSLSSELQLINISSEEGYNAIVTINYKERHNEN